jgi:hypothetical protein
MRMKDRTRKTLVAFLCFSITALMVVGFVSLKVQCAYVPAGSDYLDPTIARIELQIFGAFAFNETITMVGPTNVSRGTPYDPGDGRIKIDTEIVSMTLTGMSVHLGWITIVETSSKTSSGSIQQVTSGIDYPATSFFDVYFEFQILSLNITLHNEDSMHINATISSIPPWGATYVGPPTPVLLKDELDNTVGSITIVTLQIPLEYPELPWVEVTPANVTLGSPPIMEKEFTVDIRITGPPPTMLDERWKLIAAQFKLYFDPTLIEPVSIVEGPFLQDPTWNLYGTYFFGDVETDPTGTFALVGNLIYPNSTTGMWDQPIFPTGEGTVAKLTFRALKQDQTNPLECNLTLSHEGWGSYLIDKDATYILVDETKCAGGHYTMLPGTHDIAVLNVVPSKKAIGQGHTMDIDVTVENQGNYTENFDLVVYANTTAIMPQSLTLANITSTTITLTWDTTGWPKGNWTISANASLMFGETDMTDNNCTDGWVIVSIFGDISGSKGYPDGIVNLLDVYRVAMQFGSSAPTWDPYWGPVCDINNDGTINLIDYYRVCMCFGQTDP